MPLKLKGSSSGDVTLDVPAAAGTNTLTLPAKTGNIITSADSGTVTQAMLASNVAGNGPAFSAYVSTTTTFNANVSTVMPADTEEFDIGGCYNNTNGTVTLNGLSVPAYSFMPNIAGYYWCHALTTFSVVSASNTFITFLEKDGTEWARQQQDSATGNFLSENIGALIYMNGTTNYLKAVSAAGINSGFLLGRSKTRFSAVLVRAG